MLTTLIRGFIRSDGQIGVRNHLLVLPTVFCANRVVVGIGDQVPDAIALPHPYGCGHLQPEKERIARVLSGLGQNPNVGAVLLVGLGCQQISPETLAEEIATTGKPVECLTIQEEGDTLSAIAKGVGLASCLLTALNPKKEAVPVDRLMMGLQCGGSDYSSGLAANPAVGRVSDRLVNAGGTVLLSEVAEFLGTEDLLAKRCRTPKLAEKLYRLIHSVEDLAQSVGVDIRGAQPGPGNMKGGLSTIEEKSLGGISKGGSTIIQDVVAYGERPASKGLCIMDGPGQDLESVSGMLAAGAQVIVFTTGRGTPIGTPIAPVIKVTGNPQTAKRMRLNIDIDVSPVVTGLESLDEAGARIWETLLAAASGHQTKTEILGHREFAIARLYPSV